jgi:hypothetical protein
MWKEKRMTYHRAWQRFNAAVHCLVGPGDLRERMSVAVFKFDSLLPDELPQSIQEPFRKLRTAFETAKPSAGEGQWVASINAMGEDELARLAGEIVGLYDTACRYQEP